MKNISSKATMTEHFPPDLTLLLTIRFSASIPDVLLEIPDPTLLTAAGLKQLIRQHLPQDLSTHRLRLIYAGKALNDTSPLASSLKIASTIPGIGHNNHKTSSPLPDYSYVVGAGNRNVKDKGKTPVRDPPTPRLRTYIHCSIGDIILSAAELEVEARLARAAEEDDTEGWEGTKRPVVDNKSSSLLIPSSSSLNNPPQSSSSSSSLDAFATAPRGTISTSTSTHHGHGQQHAQSASTSTRPSLTPTGPRGFDRLLEAGFTSAEVSALRSQFLALQSLSYTPDTMPSGAELRRLEDIWMDEGASAGSMEMGGSGMGTGASGIGDAGIANYGVGTTSGAAGPLDDMLWGSVMGFFWPVGCGLWLLREQGVWSWRKGLAVFVGIVVNFGFGVVRFLN
ncbi:conserved hypothetical protein [Histoplasma capsulatum var. duboisii H88]|uniref:Ubiquitin-like domain-containing protein n=2 Tax=Ajellomyces capsulatus TaxID=5037 RepID=F0UCH3_AJEC8|nr:conserved hypothetical protein [Histoplasma capsulatum var. duboisii H88]